ncbi:hypothetical protein BKE30_15095 [Alkanindiges hydrocarboniclasticus]|uniref:Immunity protein 49 of polymorphic toxin system n=1 Tax=Alkanindiges hydrocarboniclasticus TaxID=1907941 RepID=A0A1S8CSI3_9GAMM|nr:Imm49 family immunity protein [Alkanindiges hydrocarboniclasticus]ONG37174.1 hypothetical protein BKE30_15095 [Alkanindiges hydrocarboniclasticus]
MTKSTFNYESSLQRGLEHVSGHAQAIDDLAENIEYFIEKKGNYIFCLKMIKAYTEANCMMSWFRDHDLLAFKQWAYMAAKLNRMVIQYKPYDWFPAYEHLYALLSDNEAIISWYKQHRLPYLIESEIKDRDNPKQPAFHGYQALLALNGQWDELRQRCEQILSMEIKKDRKYLIDHQFYLALANGDKTGMEGVLTELTSPKIAKVRNIEQAFGFTENFIATHAVIYAKIAWRWGYQLEIDTPWIPKDWLPIQALDNYPEPWEFLKEFDLFTPFEGEWKEWSPRHELISRLVIN